MSMFLGIGTGVGKVTGGPTGLPSAVTGLSATPGNRTMALACDAQSGCTYSFFFNTANDFGTSSQVSGASGLASPSFDADAASLGLTDANLGTPYYFWGIATNNAGDGPHGDSVSAIWSGSPVFTAAPEASADGPTAPAGLSCTIGTYAAYPTPDPTFAWDNSNATPQNSNNPIGTAGGSYTCTVTLTNSFGNASQASNTVSLS